MGLIPNSRSGKVQFYFSRLPAWAQHATAIGTTTQAVTDLQTKTEAAQAALTAQEEAKAAAELATVAADEAVAAMAHAGAVIIQHIRGKAMESGSQVYQLAQIPPPAKPSPKGEPGAPYAFKVTLEQNGALTLTWKCDNPPGATGTIYQLWRKIGGGDFEYIGGCGSRRFVDSTVPPGSANVTYQMQAVRSTVVGPWAQFNVNFGVGGTTTVTEGTPSKIAA